MESNLKLDLANLPNDIEKLQLLVSDLSRRLQNALHMVEAQKRIIANASNTTEIIRARNKHISNMLRLEIAKNETFQRSKIKDEEYQRYENIRKKAATMHEELRMALLDHSMTPIKKEPGRISKMRKKLESMEAQQDSQRLLLQHLSEQENIIENLSTSSQHGNLEECRLLIRNGANVNEVDSAGFLPLHYACSGGYDSVVRLMLEYGADVSSYMTGYAPIVLAAQNGHSNVVEVLIEFGANVEEKGKNGCPAIVSAASHSHIECVETLLNMGANINSSDLNGNTSLHSVAKLPDPTKIIQLLLMKGIDTKLANKQGQTALQLALSIVNVPAMEAFGGRANITKLADVSGETGKSPVESGR